MKDNIYQKMVKKGSDEMVQSQTVEEGVKGLNKVTNGIYGAGYEKGLAVGGVSLLVAAIGVHTYTYFKNRNSV